MTTVLTIAGTDPDGGAGIQADLKTFAAFGVYGTSIITAVVAQNTLSVQDVHLLPALFVGKQIDAIMSDIPSTVWKIGMLGTEEIVQVVAKRAAKYNIEKLVIDPVMKAKTGGSLFATSAYDVFVSQLLPRTFVLTPNKDEAEIFTGIKIDSVETMKQAAVRLQQMGAKYVVVKGGHLPIASSVVDVLYDGKRFTEITGKYIRSKNTHGTGCAFASAIAASLAKGKSVEQSVRIAKYFVADAIIAGKDLKIGRGNGPINYFLFRGASYCLSWFC